MVCDNHFDHFDANKKINFKTLFYLMYCRYVS